jgi:glycosyltransferase involved in cell wall biosynthesis
MRILILSDVSGFMPGGVPAETRELIGGLARRGHELAFAGDVPVTEAQLARHFPITIPIGRSFRRQVAATLDDFKPDFVHVICMSSRGVLMLAPLLRPHPWALTVHSVSPYERKFKLFHRHEGLHYALRSLRCLPNSLAWRWVFNSGKVPRVIAHSDFVAQVVERYGFPAHLIELVSLPFLPRPRDREAAALPANGELQLTTVGGLAHTKGQHDVIKALPALARRFPKLRYQLIGEIRDDSYVRWLKRLASRLGVADRLLFSVDLDQAAKVEALRRANVYVQPSHEEGFCLSYAEAAALVPRLVGTRTGAIAAMSRDDPGARIVPVRDSCALAEAIGALAAVDLPAGHMADRATRLSERFSYDAYLRAHEAIYAR